MRQFETKPKVLWVTNLMPPYRISLWESIGRMTTLRVALLEGSDDETLTNDRSSEWGTRDGQQFSAVDLGVKIWHRYAGNIHFGVRLRHMAELVRDADVVLLGGWESPVFVQILLMAKSMRKPVVLFHESTIKSARHRRGLIPWLKKTMFHRTDAIVVPGVASHELVRSLGIPDDRIFEGFNAVDMHLFKRSGNDVEDRRATDASRGHKFLYLGRLRTDKRIDNVIEAFSRIRRDTDRLSIVGSGPEDEALRALVASLDLQDVVDFSGAASYDEIPGVLHTHDTLVLASGHDVWGLVVNEALASGLHVVVSDHCGVSQSVSHMQGVYVWHEDTDVRLEDLMERSAKDWSGPIAEPEILAMDNERFAKVFIDGFHAALENRDGERGIDGTLQRVLRLSGEWKGVDGA